MAYLLTHLAGRDRGSVQGNHCRGAPFGRSARGTDLPRRWADRRRHPHRRLWESKEQSDRFVQAKLLPSMPVEGGFTGQPEERAARS